MSTLSRSQKRWRTASLTRSEYAKRRRLLLCKTLSPSGRCAECKIKFDHSSLTIDHVDGCSWNKRKVSAWIRVARYWREYKIGISLRAICGCCNSRLNYFRKRRY